MKFFVASEPTDGSQCVRACIFYGALEDTNAQPHVTLPAFYLCFLLYPLFTLEE